MLSNNNKKIMNRLAKNSLKAESNKYKLFFFASALATFFIFIILSMGNTYLRELHLRDIRIQGSDVDISIINGFTSEQMNIAKENSKIESVGVQTYAGHVMSSEADDTVSMGLLYADDVFWEYQHAPVRTKIDGTYPQAENEIMITKDGLESLGNGSLKIGDTIALKYENDLGIHLKEFVISGIWDGFGDKSVIYISEKLYSNSGYDLEKSGVMNITLKNDYIGGSEIEDMKNELHLSDSQVFQSSAYIDKSLSILIGIIYLCLIICISAGLFIYNILYLSLSGKMRSYGLLSALGMTKRQLKYLLLKQILFISITAICTGLIIGIAVLNTGAPYILNLFVDDIGKMNLSIYPELLLLSIVVVSSSILLASKLPLKMITNISPIEAIKYRVNNVNAGINYSSQRGNLFWKMAKYQLRVNIKKTAIIFMSIATSLIVFYSITTMIYTQGERTVVPNYWNADFIVRNDTQTSDDINSIHDALDEEMISTILAIEGVDEVHTTEGLAITFPYEDGGFSDMWMKNYTSEKPYLSYAEVVSDYQENENKYYGMLKGIDNAEFDYMNSLLGNSVDKNDFENGKIAIIQYAGFEIENDFVGSEKINFIYNNVIHQISLAAISHESYYGGSTNIGPTLIVSKEYLKSLTKELESSFHTKSHSLPVSKPYNLSAVIKYDEEYNIAAEEEIISLIENSPYKQDLFCESRYENMKSVETVQGGMMVIGSIISLLLLFIAVLNYINTISSSIYNRKDTFYIMESVGMSIKQVKSLLIREGILYATGSIFLMITLGTGITYLIFNSMNYMQGEFRIPIIPIICAIILVVIICIALPITVYNKLLGRCVIAKKK